MKLTINRADLVRITAAAADVAPSKSSLPILGCVLLRTLATSGGHLLEASATDLYVSSRMAGDCETDAPGEVCVAAKALKDLSARMPDGPVKLEFDGKFLSVKAGRSKYKLHARPSDDMPVIPTAGDGMVQVSGSALLRRLGAVSPAMSTDDSRPHLACALLDDTVAVSTDGHRLHVVKGSPLGVSALVPPKGVALLVKMAKVGDLDIGVSETGILTARQGAHTISTKTVDESFPPYQKVIPDGDGSTSYSVPRDALTDAVKRLAYVSGGPVRFRSVTGAVELAGQAVDTGEGSESVTCDATGETPWIGMNARYLLDALSAAGGEDVTLRVLGELDPVVVEGDGFEGILMPMRV